jgi:hypothetical protein
VDEVLFEIDAAYGLNEGVEVGFVLCHDALLPVSGSPRSRGCCVGRAADAEAVGGTLTDAARTNKAVRNPGSNGRHKTGHAAAYTLDPT